MDETPYRMLPICSGCLTIACSFGFYFTSKLK